MQNHLLWANLEWAECGWFQHGECGRKLLGVMIDESVCLFCGCFQGTPAKLRAYIKEGAKKHKESRTKALNFILSCLGEIE